jgi:hypothetical protein
MKTVVAILSVILFICPAGSFATTGPQVTIVHDEKPGAPVQHGLNQLMAALEAKHISFEQTTTLQKATAPQVIVAGLSAGEGAAAMLLAKGNHAVPAKAEALTIWHSQWQTKQVWVVSGHDERGLMYGLLDVADRVSWTDNPLLPFKAVKEITESPAVNDRAVSIYTMNRAYWESRIYDEHYWEKYLDMLAKNRFNSLVVIFGYENGGFLAPCYPYFFDVEGFPDVKMVGLTAEQQQKNLRAFNRLIDMAHERGIRFTAGIWDHIYRGGVQGGGIPGAKDAPDTPTTGLVWGVNENNLIAYTKAALAKFVKEIPQLDAIQFRMHNESGLKDGEQDGFWKDIFTMMKTTVPNLRLDLRAKELKESVIQSALDAGIHFRITTKYWMEQMGLPYHPTQINPEKSPRRHSYSDLLRYPKKYDMHWRLWNGGTSRILLFGDPDFTRRFVASTHLYDGDGFEVNEPLATKMEAQPHDARPFDLLNPAYKYYEYEFERYWHFFQTFGLIGYNPQTPTDIWDREFIKRFGPAAGPLVEQALHKASWVLPRIISSCYPYSLFPTTRGWVEKQRLGDLPAYAKAEGSDLMQFANADEEAALLISGGSTPKVLPSANSLWLQQLSNDINTLITKAGSSPNKEFKSTITDLKILSRLALFHARRLPAAVSYRLYERTQNVKALEAAISYERQAIEAWKEIVTAAGDVYTNDLMMGVRVADLCGHWKEELQALEKGLTVLENKKQSVQGAASQQAPVYKATDLADNHVLFKWQHAPVRTLAANAPFTVKVNVSSAPGIQWVRLRYRSVNQEEEWQTLNMTPGKEKNVYEATVPADRINQQFDFMYLVEVMNKRQQGAIFPDVNKETPYNIVILNR